MLIYFFANDKPREVDKNSFLAHFFTLTLKSRVELLRAHLRTLTDLRVDLQRRLEEKSEVEAGSFAAEIAAVQKEAVFRIRDASRAEISDAKQALTLLKRIREENFLPKYADIATITKRRLPHPRDFIKQSFVERNQTAANEQERDREAMAEKREHRDPGTR